MKLKYGLIQNGGVQIVKLGLTKPVLEQGRETFKSFIWSFLQGRFCVNQAYTHISTSTVFSSGFSLASRRQVLIPFRSYTHRRPLNSTPSRIEVEVPELHFEIGRFAA